jgi:replicative DNA helicase
MPVLRLTGDECDLRSRGVPHAARSEENRAAVATAAPAFGATEGRNDLFGDPVLSIAPAGEEEVFDLTVPGPASWLADGIVSHNSGEIEQVSDLVLFLYREDYYDQEKAQKESKENICEVIIAKHRNGPIGTVELYFHKEYSRFANLAKQR